MISGLQSLLGALWHGLTARLHGGAWVEPSNAVTRAVYGPRPASTLVPLAEESFETSYEAGRSALATPQPQAAAPPAETGTERDDRRGERPGRAA